MNRNLTDEERQKKHRSQKEFGNIFNFIDDW